MKMIVLLVCITALAFVGTGCVSYQKNRVLKQNDIRYADGTVDKSRYEDKSSGFALVGSASATRHYGSDVAVGTETHVPRPPVIVAPSYGSYGGYGYGGSVGGGYGYQSSPIGSRYHYGGHSASPSPPPLIGNRYGYSHGHGGYGYGHR